MSNEAKYFAVLSDAIAQIESDSFEARGIIYDRLWTIVLRRLQAEPDNSDEIVARERAAFLRAVRRVEFGERTPAAAQQGPEPAHTVRQPSRPGRPVLGRLALRMASACAVLLVVWFAYLVT